MHTRTAPTRLPGQTEQALPPRGRRASEGLARAHVRLLARAAAGAAALAAAAGAPPWPPAAAQLAALAARLLAGARPAQRAALARALLEARPPRPICSRARLPRASRNGRRPQSQQCDRRPWFRSAAD